MKDFDLEKLERKNIFNVPENMFKNIQEKVLSEVNDFDLEKLERKNIYSIPENLFEDIQNNVLGGLNTFDVDELERKNIYKLPESMFETVQERVLSEIKTDKKAPIFKMNWGYAAAASLALIFGTTFIYNSNSDSSNINLKSNFAENRVIPKKESQLAYETLTSDLTSVEKTNQTIEKQTDIKPIVSQVVNNNSGSQNKKSVKATQEIQMNEYIEALTSSEIAELANNSSQDVYLDLYN